MSAKVKDVVEYDDGSKKRVAIVEETLGDQRVHLVWHTGGGNWKDSSVESPDGVPFSADGGGVTYR